MANAYFVCGLQRAIVVRGLIATAFSLFWSLLLAADATKSVLPKGNASAYSTAFATCRQESGQVYFLKVFRGYWPLPTNFVLLDTRNEQLEFSDFAFPWRVPKTPSAVFYATHERFQERWGWLTTRNSSIVTDNCGVVGRDYGYVEEFRGKAVVFTDKVQYLVLMGPLADAAPEAAACYVSTIRKSKQPC